MGTWIKINYIGGMAKDWIKEGVPYWKNEDCPKVYLEGALISLMEEVEGVHLPPTYFEDDSREHICNNIEFYEYVSDK